MKPRTTKQNAAFARFHSLGSLRRAQMICTILGRDIQHEELCKIGYRLSEIYKQLNKTEIKDWLHAPSPHA